MPCTVVFGAVTFHYDIKVVAVLPPLVASNLNIKFWASSGTGTKDEVDHWCLQSEMQVVHEYQNQTILV